MFNSSCFSLLLLNIMQLPGHIRNGYNYVLVSVSAFNQECMHIVIIYILRVAIQYRMSWMPSITIGIHVYFLIVHNCVIIQPKGNDVNRTPNPMLLKLI